jgi:hypothetical protein
MNGWEDDRSETPLPLPLPWPLGPNERRSIVRLIADGTLDADVAALLWLLVEARTPIVVAAGPRGTGKSTVLDALLAFLPSGVATRTLAGYAEDFEWLPEATALGWRSHGFRGVGIRPSRPGGESGRAMAETARSDDDPTPGRAVGPASTYLLVPEFSDHLPFYTWGETARIAVRALSVGYGLGGTIHADSLEEVFAELGGPGVGLADDELSNLGVVLILRALRARGGDEPSRRIIAAHYVRPVARDGAGHVQRLGPAVLATWDAASDRLEDFAWGVVPELAERVGSRAGDFEADRRRRAGYLGDLVRSGIDTPEAVAAAIAHWGHVDRPPGPDPRPPESR